jgi:SnoaL-like domain
VERSEEIRRVVERWISALADGDVDAVLGRLSDHVSALSIGTDPDEWWYPSEAFAIWPRQIEEAGPVQFEPGEIEAWEEGTAGWAATRVTVDVGERNYVARSRIEGTARHAHTLRDRTGVDPLEPRRAWSAVTGRASAVIPEHWPSRPSYRLCPLRAPPGVPNRDASVCARLRELSLIHSVVDQRVRGCSCRKPSTVSCTRSLKNTGPVECYDVRLRPRRSPRRPVSAASSWCAETRESSPRIAGTFSRGGFSR